ncbi:MAG TPA: serine acetyltransferase [Gammaproteobacteria bacterium]|nr:serine acetyltransferase [Gammaproteobacteria bacterium]
MRALWQAIRQDYAAHGYDGFRAGFRVLLVYRFGQWRMAIKSRLLRAPLSVIYRLCERHVRFKYGIELPYTVQLGQKVVFEHQHGIVIHGAAQIGDGCIIRQGVTIGNKTLLQPHEAPQLGKRVNIGAGAKILGKIVIGDDVTIGANAVVIADVPAGAIVVGIPASIVEQSNHGS